MTRNEKDVIYLMNQPKHSILSIVVLKDIFPLSEKIHEVIEKLLEKSDVILVYSEKYFPNINKINKDRFANIYRVNGWISSDNNLAKTIISVLSYSLNIFKSHTTFVLVNSDDLEDYDNNLLENIQTASLTISRPVFKTKRLSSDQYYQIYKEDDNIQETESKETFFKKIKKVIKYCYRKFTKKPLVINKSDYLLRSYSSYTTDSKAFLFKTVTATNIVEFAKDPLQKDYINSFDWSDFRYFFTSVIKKLNLETINANLNEEGLNLSKYKEVHYSSK